MNLVRKITGIFMIVVTALILIYDLVVYLGWGGYTTISDIMLTYGRKIMMIPFAWGVLMGHFFWPQTIDKEVKSESAN